MEASFFIPVRSRANGAKDTSSGQRPISANLRGARGKLRMWGCRLRLTRTGSLEIKMALGAPALLIRVAKAIL